MGLLESVLGLGGNDASGAQSSLLGNKKVLLAAGLLAYLAMKHGNAPAAGGEQQDGQGGSLFSSLGSLAGMLGGAGALGGLGGLLGQLTGGGGNADHAAVDATAPGGIGPLQQILEQAGPGRTGPLMDRQWPEPARVERADRPGAGRQRRAVSTGFDFRPERKRNRLATRRGSTRGRQSPDAARHAAERMNARRPQTEKPANCGLFHASPHKKGSVDWLGAQANE